DSRKFNFVKLRQFDNIELQKNAVTFYSVNIKVDITEQTKFAEFFNCGSNLFSGYCYRLRDFKSGKSNNSLLVKADFTCHFHIGENVCGCLIERESFLG